MRIEHCLERHIRERPDMPALIDLRSGSATMSWRELFLRVTDIAAALVDAGLNSGAPVGLIMQDRFDCIAAVYAIMATGGVVVPIDPLLGSTSIQNMVRHAMVRTVLIPDSTQFEVRPILFDDGVQLIALSQITAKHGKSFAMPQQDDANALAMMAFTSGSTAAPKAIALRHCHMVAAYHCAANAMFGESGAPNRFGSVLRLSGLGILGMNFLFPHQLGSTAVKLPDLDLHSAPTFWDNVCQAHVNYVYLVPALVNMLNKLAHPPSRRPDTLCLSSAAPLSPEMHELFQTRFGVPLRNGYGLTEASFMFLYGALDEQGMGRAEIGQAESVRCELLDDDGHPLPLDTSGPVTGELWISGPMVGDGYFNNPGSTAEVYVRGGLRTGDIATRSPQGMLTITGRKKDVVLRGGFTIYLDEVDAALASHPDVVDACAIAVANEVSGEEILAFVKLRDGAISNLPDILLFARETLGFQRAPRRIKPVQHIARNGAGKLMRRHMAEAGHQLSSPGEAR